MSLQIICFQIIDQFKNLRNDETYSPAPPPPSPEIPSSHATESTTASRGISKLATSDGISSTGLTHKKSGLSNADNTPTTEVETPNPDPQDAV